MSPTARTLAKLRKEGWPLVQVVERWNGFARRRQDLFGFIDVLAVRGNNVLAVQCTSGSNVSARVAKLKVLPSVKLWMGSAHRFIEIHGWAKRGKTKRWQCRVLQAHWCGLEYIKPVFKD